VNKRVWFPVSKFPTPGIPLLVKTSNGEYESIRPNYSQSYTSDPDFRHLKTNVYIKGVIEWSIL
jgi:hypothetical protein